MSFDDRNSSLDASNGPPITEIVDVGFDVRLLGSIVAESEEIHTDDSELLTRLESADTVASGVEARLDEILGTLDDLLIRLEPKDDELHQVGIQRSESQPDHPPLSNHEVRRSLLFDRAETDRSTLKAF